MNIICYIQLISAVKCFLKNNRAISKENNFSVNIIGDDGIFLLHVDFRPYIDTIVLNNFVDGAWQAEVR